jgi:hypothetical protein
VRGLCNAMGGLIVIILTTCVVLVACRVKWDFTPEDERGALVPGGEHDLALWALVLGFLVLNFFLALGHVLGRRGG